MNKHIYLLLIIIACVCFTTFQLNQKELVEEVVNEVESMQSFLLCEDKLVMIPTSTSAKKVEDKVVELIHYMKQGSDDFEALLKENTQLDKVNIENGVMCLSFSELDYDQEKEVRVLEALIYSCTQFAKVERIQIKLNEQILKAMPIRQTPIHITSRAFGINHLQSNQLYLHEGEQITLYYVMKCKDKTYQCMQSIPINKSDDYDEVLTLMFKNVNVSSHLVQPLAKYKLVMQKPSELKKGVLHLYLNKQVLNDAHQINEEILMYLKLNLKQFEKIKYISIHVNGKVISEKGKNKIAI